MGLIDKLGRIVGRPYVFCEDKGGKYGFDWTGLYQFSPLAVVRPANATEVSQILKLANGDNIPIVPMSGNTSLAGGLSLIHI